MNVFPLLAASFIMNVVAVLFVICCVALILIVLIQKGRGGGLSAAFGGGAAGGILGSKTGDFLTWVTIVLAGVFLMLAVVMAKFYRPDIGDHGADQSVQQEQATDTQQTLPVGADESATGDGSSGDDTNLPDG
jgi:preprotein translocase subunit SecG